MSNQERLLRANAIRFLSMDAVQQANSGHPGMPMGMADIAEVLWHDYLNHNPNNPDWFNRDRFVLSNGHGSMLLYSLLHLTGYDLSVEDLKQFRQLNSKTPGHPEYGYAPGVETTTGPLGQGLANAVGMAIAEKHLAAAFNQPGYDVVDHHTYCFAGDGDLMEGVSHEACSFAGDLGLGKLIVFYDDNDISIDGDVNNWFAENTAKRFEAYGWHVIDHVDGHDSDAIAKAVKQAKSETDKPSIICCKTIIGWGAPSLAGSAKTHGAALGAQEIAEIRKKLQWPYPAFSIPDDIYASWDARRSGQELEQAWQAMFVEYQHQHPALAEEFLRRMEGRLPEDWETFAGRLMQEQNQKKQTVATRKASQFAIDHFAPHMPEMLGGSADLTESNCTNWKDMTVFDKAHPQGRYIHYGVREFGMSAIMNGMALHKGITPFGGTFLTFSDYARNAVRLSALMAVRVVYVYTHDSIGLGEDGPTHQPVEQLSSLRLMPGLNVWRPCDTVETAAAWRHALENDGPSCLVFSRQSLAFQQRNEEQMANINRGAYILCDYAEGRLPDMILMATGSEVDLAMQAAKKLKEEAIYARVVSMPSTDVFLQQDEKYQQSVLPDAVMARVAIEAGSSAYWYRFVGLKGGVVGLDRFGASAPAKQVFEDNNFNSNHVVNVAKEVIYAVASAMSHFHAKSAAGAIGNI